MISRRGLITAAVTGMSVGLAGVYLIQGDASIRFIGRRSTIITLLDTGTERVLMVLGDQDDELLENIVGLKTVGNTRVDLVIASHRILATRSARMHLRIDSTQTIAIQASASLPPIRGEVTSATQAVSLDIGKQTSIQIAPSAATLSSSNAHHPDFVVSATCHNTSMILASSDAALRLSDGGICDLLAVPGSPGDVAMARINPQLFVSNRPLVEEASITQMQVFESDPQTIRIGDGKLQIRDDQLSS